MALLLPLLFKKLDLSHTVTNSAGILVSQALGNGADPILGCQPAGDSLHIH